MFFPDFSCSIITYVQLPYFQAENNNASTEPTEPEVSLEDSLDVHLVEHEKRKRILRRGSKAAPKLPNFHNVSPSDSRKMPDADDESSIDNVDDLTPQIENLKMK